MRLGWNFCGPHEHAPWTIDRVQGQTSYATSVEAEYPHMLCSKIADAALQEALRCGALHKSPATKRTAEHVVGDDTSSSKRPRPSSSFAAQAGQKPRGNRQPELLSEFSEVVQKAWPLNKPAKLPKILTNEQLQHFGFSHEAKLLSCVATGSGTDESSCVSDAGSRYIARIGIYPTPEEFVEVAQDLQHPFDRDTCVDDFTKRNMFMLLTEGHQFVSDWREKN